MVWLLNARADVDDVECEIQAALTAGPRYLNDLVDEVADRLIKRACLRSGGAPEVALLGARLFPGCVAQTIAAIDGDVVRVALG